MRVLAAVLILTALGIGMFPRVLQYRSARELASTSARSSAWRAGHTRRPMRRSPRQVQQATCQVGAAGDWRAKKDPLAELYDDPQNAANNASADGSDNSSDSASAKDKEYQSLLDSGDGVMGHPYSEDFREPAVYHGTSGLTLASGAVYGSSLPVGSTPKKPPSAPIGQQARRIDELQRENEDLRAKLDELTA